MYIIIFPLSSFQVNEVTEAVTIAAGDPNMRNLQKGAVCQIERRGFYRVDEVYGGSAEKPMRLFMIPDGKKGNVSKLTNKFAHH